MRRSILLFSFLSVISINFANAIASSENLAGKGQADQKFVVVEPVKKDEIQSIHKSIENIVQNETKLRQDIDSILKIINQKPVKGMISIETKTDINQLLLILITLVTVLASTYYSVFTLKKKSEESIKANTDTIIAQRDISEIKVKTEILSGNRQQWINTLRTEISEYLASLLSLQAEFVGGGAGSTDSIGNLYKTNRLHRARIHLLINPKEADHKKLVELVDAAPSYLRDSDKLAVSEKQIIEISQQILKREWERVKSIE